MELRWTHRRVRPCEAGEIGRVMLAPKMLPNTVALDYHT